MIVFYRGIEWWFHTLLKVITRSDKSMMTQDGSSVDLRCMQNKQHQQVFKLPMNSVWIGQSYNLGAADYEVALARTKSKSNCVYQEGEVPLWVDNSHLEVYGPGLFLYFELLRQLTYLLGLISVISCVPVIYNWCSSNYYANISGSAQLYFARTTIGTLQPIPSVAPKLINAVCDCLCAFIFFVFYFYWDRFSTKKVLQIREKVLLPSYFTVQVKRAPQQASKQGISKLLSHFGEVNEISAVKNFEECIYYAKSIYKLELKKVKLSFESPKVEEVEALEAKRLELIKKLNKEIQTVQNETLKFYCSFKSIKDRDQCVQEYEKRQKCCFSEPYLPEMCLMESAPITVLPCDTQPTEIMWENVHIRWRSRWIRFLLQLIVLLALLFAALLIICLLSVVNPPLNNASIDTSIYTSQTILTVTDDSTLESWCLKNSATVLQSGSEDVQSLCSPFISRYLVKIAITVSVSVTLVAVKLFLRKLVCFIARFQRYKTYTEEAKNTMVNLLVCYSLTTVIIPLMLQADIFGLSPISLLKYFVTDSRILANMQRLPTYEDLNHRWYLDVGYQLALTWMLLAIWPQMLNPLLLYLGKCYGEWAAKRETIQQDMERKMEPLDFTLDDHYANILMLVGFGMALSGGMPVLRIITFIALLIKYISNRIEFIYFCRIPRTVDDSINEFATKWICWTALLHLLMSIWVFGQPDLFTREFSVFSSLANYQTQYVSVKWLVQILNRLANTWYMSILFAIFLTGYFLRETVIRVVSGWIGKGRRAKAPTSILTAVNTIEFKPQKATTYSYELSRNPDYAIYMKIINECAFKDIYGGHISPADSVMIKIEDLDGRSEEQIKSRFGEKPTIFL